MEIPVKLLLKHSVLTILLISSIVHLHESSVLEHMSKLLLVLAKYFFFFLPIRLALIATFKNLSAPFQRFHYLSFSETHDLLIQVSYFWQKISLTNFLRWNKFFFLMHICFLFIIHAYPLLSTIEGTRVFLNDFYGWFLQKSHQGAQFGKAIGRKRRKILLFFSLILLHLIRGEINDRAYY